MVHILFIIAFIGQRYKIWKQITTENEIEEGVCLLLLLVKDTKFESKSQLKKDNLAADTDCFYWSKIQNLKANHNNDVFGVNVDSIAFIGQRYKIWKQITTVKEHGIIIGILLLLVKDTKFESKSQHKQIKGYHANDCFYWSKIQNLKANHNIWTFSLW